MLPACEPCNARKDNRLLSELDFVPARPPDDARVWVVLAPGQQWAPDLAYDEFQKRVGVFGLDRPPSGVRYETTRAGSGYG